jgi:hypothetical protein
MFARALALFAAAALIEAPARAELLGHRVMIPERGEVIAYIVTFETNHYSFLPPPGWRVSSKPNSRGVVMIASNLTTSITVDFIGFESVPDRIDDALKDLLSVRYPDGRLQERFPSFSGLGGATAFDVERKAANSLSLASRVVYASQPWGVVEFTLTAPTAKFAEFTASFANTVNSFQLPAR